MEPIPKDGMVEVKEEVLELSRRYIKIFPESVRSFEKEEYIGFTCLVEDEETGITRTLLERLGYILEPSIEKCYEITLRTRVEKRRKK